MKNLIAGLLAGLSLLAAGGIPASADTLLDGFEDATAWQARRDGGNPPQFSLETARVHSGKAALRLHYGNSQESGWGNLQRAFTLPEGDGALSLWIYLERAEPRASMHLWLEEPDGDLWVAPVTEAGASVGNWATGCWHHAVLPLTDFRYDGRGNKRQEREKTVRLLLGCNFGNFDAVVDDLAFIPKTAAQQAHADADPLFTNQQFTLGENDATVTQLLGEGWYSGEGATLGRWTGRGGKPAALHLSLQADREYLLSFHGNIPASLWQDKRSVTATLDGAPLADVQVDAAQGNLTLRIPAAKQARNNATLTLQSGIFVPAQVGQGNDSRALGMKLSTLTLAGYPRLVAGAQPARGPRGSVAVLRDTLPRSGAPADPEYLGALLRQAGYGVTFVRALDLLNPLYLTAKNFDLLVLPYGADYPAEGKAALVRYLQNGGAFFSTGGYAFNNPLLFHNGKWVDKASYLTSTETGFVDVGGPGDDAFLFGDWNVAESGHWEWGSGSEPATKRWTGTRAGIRMMLDPAKAYTLQISMAYRGAEWYAQNAKSKLPIHGRVLLNGKPLGEYEGEAGTAVLSFPIPQGMARSGKPSELVLETRTWSPADVTGGGDNRRVGIAVNWVKAIPAGVSEADLATPSAGFDVQINTARGKPGDALGLEPEQIGAFDPSYPLQDAVRAVAAPDQYVAPATLRLNGPFTGYAAAGMFGNNSAVFPRGYARWIPLLNTQDAAGHARGALGALALHHDGPFAGSGWAFFGVTNRDLFARGNQDGTRLFLNTVAALQRRTFLHSLRSSLACYRPGEAVKASVQAANYGKAPQKLQVRFTIPGVAGTRIVDGGVLAPGKSIRLEASWPVFRFTRDLYRVRAVLLLDGKEADSAETGFAVWNPRIIAAGPRITLKENYFNINGRPSFLCGTNQTGMVFASAFENPLVWDRDLAQMHDNGVSIMRVLHFSPFAKGSDPQSPWSPQDLRQRPERLVRQTDALVQLCQKHGVVLFLSLHDWMGVGLTDEELALQRDWARFWAGRYRDVPGIIYDVQNEPTVDTPDNADLRREWNRFLNERYGTDAALRAAWQTDSPALGRIALETPQNGWNSVRAHDYAVFRAEAQNRWVRANVEGVHEADPDALCTVGYLDSLTSADKLLGARYSDFSNMHCYLQPENYPKNLKLIDRRFDGKSFSLGEFGAKCHPAWNPSAFVGVTEAQGANHFLRIGHYALGMGASFIANWSWKDMIDCVFPWGIVHPGDGVPKDVLPAYRNMSLFFRLCTPRYRDPGLYLLVTDSLRQGDASGAAYHAALNAIQWLLDARVPFNVINEGDLDRLPQTARTLIWPTPGCPEDAAYAQVKRFVQNGGTLLVTGDLSYDAQRQRTRAGRLEELCGVRLTVESGAVLKPDATVAVAPAGAQPVAGAATPVLYRYACEKGQVFYTPVPVELDDAGGSALYQRFLPLAGIKPEPVTAASSVNAFRVDMAAPGSAWAFFNTAEQGKTETVEAAGVRLALAPGKPGFVRVDGAGKLTAVETQGAVSVGGKQIAVVSGHAMLAALDGKPLSRTRALLVLPIGAGSVRVENAGWKDAVCQVGEFQRGRWRVLQSKPAVKQGAVAVTIPAAQRNYLFLVCERAESGRWAQALEKLLRFE